MRLIERLTYCLIGAIFGALVGVVCWWLYGLAHSLRYDGPGVDPVLKHWLTYVPIAFAVAGFVFRERIGDILGDAFGAITDFESNQSSGRVGVIGVLFLAIAIAAIWMAVPDG